MSVSEEYEIKFHIYDGFEPDIDELLVDYTFLRDVKKSEDGVMAKVITHFYNGLISLVRGDINLWNGNYRNAYLAFQESGRLLNNFKISRTVKVKLDKYAQRIDHRAKGLKLVNEGFLALDPQKKDELFISSLEEFNHEVSIANEMGDQMGSYAAFSRASFAQSQLFFYRAKALPQENSGQAKKYLLDSRDAIRQAGFIEKRFLTFLDEINDQIDIITRKRLLKKAELSADEATHFMENSKFQEAVIGFNRASLFYRRASVLASDTSSRRMLLASATLYDASICEAEAIEAQKNLEIEITIEKFKDALSLVDKAIALMGQFGTESLVNSFKCQKDYYKGFYTQTLAIKEFDSDNYKEANDLFNESKIIFKDAIKLAKLVDNQSISNLSEATISEINSYITMCENLE